MKRKGEKLKIICSAPHYTLTHLWKNSLWKWTLMILLFILKGIWHTIDIFKYFVMSFLLRQIFHDEPLREKFHHRIWQSGQETFHPMWVPLNPTNPQRFWDALFSLTCSEICFRQGIHRDMPHLASTKNLVSCKVPCAVLLWLTLCITLHMRM